MYSKFFCIAILSGIIISSCVLKKDNTQAHEAKIDFNEFENKYLKNYEKKVKNSTFKPEAYSRSFEIKKKYLDNKGFKALDEKLKLDGWRIIESNNGYYYYCNGRNYSFDALYPTSSKHFNKNGIPIIYDDYNSWSFVMSYNKYGDYRCLD